MRYQTQRKRLQMMVDLLGRIQRSKKLHAGFNLRFWVNTRVHDDFAGYRLIDKDLFRIIKRKGADKTKIIQECGTSACACGYAGLDPEFRKMGFKYENMSKNEYPYMGITYKDLEGWEAVKGFFGLDQETAERLFHQAHYDIPVNDIEPKHVAKGVRELIKRLDKENNFTA